MSAAAVLPFVWASVPKPDVPRLDVPRLDLAGSGLAGPDVAGPGKKAAPEQKRNRTRMVRPELAFYRKYTEGMLRRYVSMSLESGRVPSLLGKEMFRGNVTSYKVHGFDDVVIFLHDMERCIGRLDEEQQRLIRYLGIQQFTLQEVAQMLRLTRKTVLLQYNETMNRLTGILLEVRLLEPFVDPQNSCQ